MGRCYQYLPISINKVKVKFTMSNCIYNTNPIFYVYLWIYENKVFWVGKGKENRFCQFTGRKSCTKLYNKLQSIKNKGEILEDSITVWCLHKNLIEEESFRLEKFYIAYFGKENLCNLTDGGDGFSGLKSSPETRKKIGDTLRNKPSYIRTPEIIQKWIVKNTGQKRSNISKENMRTAQSKITWKIMSPSGEIFIIKNMKQFCSDREINCGHMYQVALCNIDHHKGWKCEKLSE